MAREEVIATGQQEVTQMGRVAVVAAVRGGRTLHTFSPRSVVPQVGHHLELVRNADS